MKRYKVVKDFIACLKENDIAIFAGEELSKEAFQYDREGNFYIMDSPGVAAPLALGVAMNSDKRVFVFCGDGEFLTEIGAYAQASVSKCKNIFCVILDNDCYQTAGGPPTIFRSLNSAMGTLFNFGFTTFNYTPHFKGRVSIPNMYKKIENIVGPVAILITLDKGVKSGLEDITLSKKELSDRLSNFIKDREIGTSLYVPPLPLDFFDIDVDGGN
jgi:hypothetical protein